MKTNTSFHRRYNNGSIYRDSANGLIRGVCAGIADALNVDRLVVRLATVIAFLILPKTIIIAYIIAAIIMRDRPYYD